LHTRVLFLVMIANPFIFAALTGGWLATSPFTP
jgi:hypothetical protein